MKIIHVKYVFGKTPGQLTKTMPCLWCFQEFLFCLVCSNFCQRRVQFFMWRVMWKFVQPFTPVNKMIVEDENNTRVQFVLKFGCKWVPIEASYSVHCIELYHSLLGNDANRESLRLHMGHEATVCKMGDRVDGPLKTLARPRHVTFHITQ